MEHTIRRLEYTLKDADVKANEEMTILIQRVINSLHHTLTKKHERWEKEEKEMGDCPCGTCS